MTLGRADWVPSVEMQVVSKKSIVFFVAGADRSERSEHIPNVNENDEFRPASPIYGHERSPLIGRPMSGQSTSNKTKQHLPEVCLNV
jgi:hypothetical protein